jgi:hypothetical protein
MDSFSVSLERVAQDTGFTSDQLAALNTKFAEGGLLKSSSSSLSEFLTKVDGVKDNVKGLAEDLSPLIGDFTDLGLSSDQAASYLANMAAGMDDVTQGSIDDLVVKINENIDQLTTLGSQYGQGEISLRSYGNQVEALGFTHRQAMGMATGALDQYGKKLTETGKTVLNFAGLSQKALGELASSVVEAFGQLGSNIKEAFSTTPKELQKQFDQMLAAAIRWKRDIGMLLALKPGTFGLSPLDMSKFEEYLLQTGPDAVDAFLRSNKSAQQEMVREWLGTVGALNKGSSNIKDAEIKITADTSQANAALDALLTKLSRNGITSREQGIIKNEVNLIQGGAQGGLIGVSGFRPFALGGSTTDTVPAMLTPGEFVMRREAVDRIGIQSMRAMNAGGSVSGRGSGGILRITDWRSGLASLESELGWEDAVRTR